MSMAGGRLLGEAVVKFYKYGRETVRNVDIRGNDW